MQRLTGWSMALLAVVTLVGCAAPVSSGTAVPATSLVDATVITGSPDPGFPAGDPQDPHRAAALVAVAAMLASTTLPPGAHRVDSSPTPAVDQTVGSASPNLIDAVQWWTIPEVGGQVLQFTHDHPPAGTTASGSNNLATINTMMFAGTAKNPAYSWPEVDLSVSDLPGGSSAIRVDAKAIWIPTRTPAETISDQITSVDVTLHFNGKTLKRRASGSAAVAVGRALDALQPSAPVEVAGGPMSGDTGFIDELLFHGGGSDVAVILTVDGPFAGAQIKVGGKQQPTLAGYHGPGPAPRTVDLAVMTALGLPVGYRK